MAGYMPRECRHCSTWFGPTSARQLQCADCRLIEEAEWWAEHGYPDREEQIPAMRAAQQKRRIYAPPRNIGTIDPAQTAELKELIGDIAEVDPERVRVVLERVSSEHFERYGLGAPMSMYLYRRAVLVRLGEVPPRPRYRSQVGAV